MSLLHVHPACPFFMTILHVVPCCLSLLAAFLHIFAAYLCCMFLFHVPATCPCCMSMLHVLAACPCCFSMLHVHVAYLCCMSMLYVNAACPCRKSLRCYMSILHVFEMETKNFKRNETKLRKRNEEKRSSITSVSFRFDVKWKIRGDKSKRSGKIGPFASLKQAKWTTFRFETKKIWSETGASYVEGKAKYRLQF
jgi:hypothetical protein